MMWLFFLYWWYCFRLHQPPSQLIILLDLGPLFFWSHIRELSNFFLWWTDTFKIICVRCKDIVICWTNFNVFVIYWTNFNDIVIYWTNFNDIHIKSKFCTRCIKTKSLSTLTNGSASSSNIINIIKFEVWTLQAETLKPVVNINKSNAIY